MWGNIGCNSSVSLIYDFGCSLCMSPIRGGSWAFVIFPNNVCHFVFVFISPILVFPKHDCQAKEPRPNLWHPRRSGHKYPTAGLPVMPLVHRLGACLKHSSRRPDRSSSARRWWWSLLRLRRSVRACLQEFRCVCVFVCVCASVSLSDVFRPLYCHNSAPCPKVR